MRPDYAVLSGVKLFLLLANFLPETALAVDDAIPEEDAASIIPKPNVYFLHVTSDIRYRYAHTLVTSRVANPANVSQEVSFHVVLPETAFITGFIMTIEDKNYKAYVKEKEAAKEEYAQAVSAGQAAAHVAYSARDSNQFTVSINIEPLSKATFNLTYEEFLKRTLSVYKHEININPGQLVTDLSVVVNIEDMTPIINLKVPDFRETNEIKEIENDNPLAKIEKITPEKYSIEWAPSLENQRELNGEGIQGQFVVKYDVDRSQESQQILVDEGYFVHFFAKDNLPPLNKHVVFVLDLSGSMHGRKLSQVKEAMEKILSDLNPNDFFSLILFSEIAKAWAPNKTVSLSYTFSYNQNNRRDEELSSEYIVEANKENIADAKAFIKDLQDFGGTNIIAGLRMGLKLTKIGKDFLKDVASHPEPILIFLTDGEPNVEMLDTNEITKVVTSLNSLRSAIFSLGFGDGADLKFLRNLSLANSGFARNIYEGSDATLQLNTFFREVASPLLGNVTFKYLPNQVDNGTTKLHFDTLFSGSELVVVGKLLNDTLNGSLIARSPTGKKEFSFSDVKPICVIDLIPPHPTPANRTEGHLERMWAYETIRQLLDKNLVEQDENIKEQALKLALRYSFVTPLTSLVVVKPNETTAVDAEKSQLGSHDYVPLSASGYLHSPQFSYAFPARPMIGLAPSYALSMSGGRPSAIQGLAGSSLSTTPFYKPALSTYHPTQISQAVDSIDIALESETIVEVEYLNYTDVSWLANQTVSNEEFLQPPPSVSTTDVISLNATNESKYPCLVNGTTGECKHFIFCVLRIFAEDVSEYKPYECHIAPKFLGVCCPQKTT